MVKYDAKRKKYKISIEMGEETYKTINKLKKKLEVNYGEKMKTADVFRKSLSLLEMLVDDFGKGKSLQVIQKGNKIKEISFVDEK